MDFSLRQNGRTLSEIREISARLSVMPNSDGSALFQIGNTKVLAYVHGPHETSLRGRPEDT